MGNKDTMVGKDIIVKSNLTKVTSEEIKNKDARLINTSYEHQIILR